MHRDYVGLASIFLRLAMAPDAMIGSSEIGRQDQGGNAIKTITGRIVREAITYFSSQKKEASALTCWRVQAGSEPMRARR